MKRMIYLLSPTVHEGTIHLPMITFSILDKVLDLSPYDLLLFTSKQAVISADKLNPKWKNIPCLAIGPATAKQIESLGGIVYFQPKSFYGEALSQEIITKFKEKKILYLRPKEVSFDTKGFLAKEGISLDEEIIYETQCVAYHDEKKPEKNAIVIFTSPSSIHCFLKNFDWDMSYTAVLIGESTKAHLPQNIDYEIADEPLIGSCMAKAKEILTANRL